MRPVRIVCCWIVSLCLINVPWVTAADDDVGPDRILLWPAGAPGAQGTEEADQPSIRWYPAPSETNTHAAVVICPGGGYGALATDHEGHQLAKWFNTIGVNAAVLRYRLGPKYNHPAPLHDVQRAIRLVRSHVDDWAIDPPRVGVMGFSAGGHLASTVSTHWDRGHESADDAINRLSCRPDFTILGYPVVSLVEEYAHRGSARNLLGENASQEMLTELSNDQQVNAETPPAFLFHTAEDPGVSVLHSLGYYTALIKNGVPAELHVYQYGPHGVGMAIADPVVGTWTTRLGEWMKTTGLLWSGTRHAFQGEVKVDGEPLRWGMIRFTPTDNPQAPVAWAMVGHGKYSIPANRGVAAGSNEVQLFDLGDVKPWPTIKDAVALPLKLTARVEGTPDKPVEFSVDINRPAKR